MERDERERARRMYECVVVAACHGFSVVSREIEDDWSTGFIVYRSDACGEKLLHEEAVRWLIRGQADCETVMSQADI